MGAGIDAQGYLVFHCWGKLCGHQGRVPEARASGKPLKCSHCGSRDVETRRIWVAGLPPDNVVPLKCEKPSQQELTKST